MVERHLAKVNVARSNRVARFDFCKPMLGLVLVATDAATFSSSGKICVKRAGAKINPVILIGHQPAYSLRSSADTKTTSLTITEQAIAR